MKSTFETLFGLDPRQVQQTCIIIPFDIPGAAKHLEVPGLKPGKLFSAGQGRGLTLIRSGMGAGFVGDCVLWLEETSCKNIIFLGTCGLIEKKADLKIGTVVTPKMIYPMESFSALLNDKQPLPRPLEIRDQLIRDMSLVGPRCVCVSFPSLHEEERFRPLFKKIGADVIEMEAHAFFTAASRIQRQAAAVLIISDIMGTGDFCFNLSAENKKDLAEGISQACQTIKKFLN